jgi:hypothetical protein
MREEKLKKVEEVAKVLIVYEVAAIKRTLS